MLERRGGEEDLGGLPVPRGLQREMLPRMALWFCSPEAVWTHHHLQPPRAIAPRRGGVGGSGEGVERGKERRIKALPGGYIPFLDSHGILPN